MRFLLVLDTCGLAGFVALLDADAAVRSLTWRTIAPRETQERLLPAIAEVLADAGVDVAQLAAVAVVTGPGSFTGVRIGLAVAKGLAEATGAAVIACSRLAVVAMAASLDGEVTAWLDAGRSDVYAGLYRLQAGAVPLCVREEMMLRATAVQALQTVVVVAEPALAGVVSGAVLVSDEDVQRATVELATRLFLSSSFADPALLDANYLRVPDAELALRARQAAV